MAKSIFSTGATVRVRAIFEDPDTGELVDPLTVSIKVRPPSGTDNLITKVYGTDPEVVREGMGQYLYRLTLDEEGTYRWKWIGQAVDETAVISGTLESMSEVDF